MISIHGEFIIKFKIEDKEDFIDFADLKTFSIIEDTGVNLPTFKLIFITSDETIMKYFNEGANFQVSFGEDELHTNAISLMCTSVVMNKVGSDSHLITLAGILDAVNYITTPGLYISSSEESALAVLGQIAGNYFDLDIDPTNSEDSQIYIQPNISDKKFITELLQHTKLSGSAPISGITCEGKFKVRDIKKLASEPYKWKFTKDVSDESVDIFYESGDTLQSSSGMINSLIGYGRNIYELNYVTGLSSINNDTTTTVFSNSSAPSRKGSIVERMGPIVPINDNIDSDYYKTSLRNSMYNLTCSQYTKTVRVVDKYKKIEVLDLVMYNEIDVTNDRTLEYTSGLYVVTKVVRNISGGFFQTICELCRESLNDAKGDLR
jgi:hypothetical protein